ncbi:hypothetical protein COW99_04300 [Candidatus Roizmanbacteria bacterium CG22_combo_CG10-13_8_21_14_all_38_20]|uniref:Histidine phosphatase family protein n=1 Tax=Candidatus Roizmanbacteria bacterium CG22_combo_CG10-13_8_21_14_all_38_20 TaxID=1974862 RepID=A0A2H0BUT5_9BACT|nr:MAG: hypothetical protein COW99_04300 [Candidatus Roizmanbacteria bacterium CG22_combo_CG10-13_8_21_14_all_38_20]PJC30516.1 MAG: histidine phosphatase family protein [Candidatus Roizmanbacteria bacterium CG_4_9_14_0_2_um_filter_38_17]
MKNRFYLVRHGKTKKQIGDPPLSIKGIKQARSTAKYFKLLPIQKLLASPIIRTQQTAQYIADVLALDVVTLNLLRERVNWGDDPNQTFDDFLAMWQRASLERNWQPPVGDSSYAAGERICKIISSTPDELSHIVLVTHGGIITDFLRNVFEASLLDNRLTNFSKAKDGSLIECSITIVDYYTDKSAYDLVELGSTSHLHEL